MVRVQIFILLTIFTLISGQCNEKKVKEYLHRSIYEFTMKLAVRINQDTESHFVTSGLSPWTLISVLSLGAADETLSEITHVLRMHPHICFNNKFYEIIRKMTTNTMNDAILERSASIFVDNNMKLSEDFKSDVLASGVCDIRVLPFDPSDVAAAVINEFVSNATHDAIDEIVTSADLDDAAIIMIDALYFKAPWKLQFEYADTEVSAFYDDRGRRIGDVNLMFKSDKYYMTSIKLIDATVLELPYGVGERFAMLLILPKKDVTVTQVLEKLNNVSLRTIYILLKKGGAGTVAIQIPRFKVTSDINMKEFLIDMGLTRMFDRNGGNFEDMTTDRNVFVSNLAQKVDIEVTEDGTVAAAITEAELQPRMMTEEFVANKPFLFMIVDKEIEIPLFIGAYTKPRVF